ncbi:MarR family winged helix-turn-helix transcriptional regulator [Antribacter gilvus]|uniref:MarR family winged helix-turn-helix transcriptional regulator n=1 Tax=Antribacter gilvus TaxID=2304675 RepID=UPI000F774932|nr:MarR family transcriptional regulator [Antribacter gilvus]
MAKQEDRTSVVTGLVRAAFLVDAVYAASARDHGLTPQQGQLLCVLLPQAHGMSDLVAMLGLAKSSLTGLVDRSERNGYVRRAPDPYDTRAVRVSLTEAGRRLADEFYRDTCRRVGELTAGLDAPDTAALARLLDRVVIDNEVPEVFMDPGDAPPGRD